MQKRLLTTVAVLAVILAISTAEILEPTTYDEAMVMMDDFKHNITTLVFVDPAIVNAKLKNLEEKEEEEQSSGFFSGLLSSVAGVFASRERSIGDLVYDLSQDNVVIEIDTTNPEFDRMQDTYNVVEIPFIIIMKGNKILYRESASKNSEETIRKIIQAYNEENQEKERTKQEKQSSPLETEVVTIAPGQSEFRASSTDSPFYFGDEQDFNGTNVETVKTVTTTTIPASRVDQYPVYSPYATPGPSFVETRSRVVSPGNQTAPIAYRGGYMAPMRTLPETNTTQRIKYSEIVTDRVVPTLTDRVPSRVSSNYTSRYVTTPFGYRASDNQYENFDEKWKTILNEEEKMVDEIKRIYDDDSKLSDSLKESEDEIHQSEELFYKAKNALDKTLMDSEQQMREYERELDRLYRARQTAIKAREDLYHPCPNCVPTKDGYVQQRLTGPYKVIPRPGGPRPESYNFHDMLESTNSTSTGDKDE